LCERIKKAKEHITIVTPYFSPGAVLRKLLVKASERGVKISVVIPETTDHFIAQINHASYIFFSKKANISLVAAKKMNHAKIIYIDNWLTFGSSNFDRLSLFYNKELNIQTEDTTIIREIKDKAIIPFFKNTKPFVAIFKEKHQSLFVRFMISIFGYFVRPIV
jgi:cardiolipin synthase